MIRVLLCVEQTDLRELLSFRLSSTFPLTVQEVPSVEEITALLTVGEIDKKAEPIDLLITPVPKNDSVFVQHLQQMTNPITQIYFYEKKAPNADQLKGLIVLGCVEMQNFVEGISALVSDFVAKTNEKEDDLEFCPIRTSLLIRSTPLKSDIYIRLSSKKFLKLFHAGTDFTSDDLQKYYHTKKVEYLYLRRLETKEFLSGFIAELDDIMKNYKTTGEDLFDVVEKNQEMVEHLVQRLGFAAEVQELAKKNVEITLLSVADIPKLSDLFAKLEKRGNYLSQHSVLIAHLSCCIAKEMDWVAENTFKKLILAAYMHDVTLQNPALAKVKTLADLLGVQDQFDPKEVAEYSSHPEKAAELVKSFQEIPADVDVIVLQHHERPNGSGFPGKLIYSYIAPLSTVFIIAHDIAQEMLSNEGKFNIADFITCSRKEYSQGNFKKVMSSLERLS